MGCIVTTYVGPTGSGVGQTWPGWARATSVAPFSRWMTDRSARTTFSGEMRTATWIGIGDISTLEFDVGVPRDIVFIHGT